MIGPDPGALVQQARRRGSRPGLQFRTKTNIGILGSPPRSSDLIVSGDEDNRVMGETASEAKSTEKGMPDCSTRKRKERFHLVWWLPGRDPALGADSRWGVTCKLCLGSFRFWMHVFVAAGTPTRRRTWLVRTAVAPSASAVHGQKGTHTMTNATPEAWACQTRTWALWSFSLGVT